MDHVTLMTSFEASANKFLFRVIKLDLTSSFKPRVLVWKPKLDGTR